MILKDRKNAYLKFFKALSNSERIDMFEFIRKKEMFALEMGKLFYLEQPTVSHHLNTLRRAGIIKTRKEGRNVFYSIDYENLRNLWDEIGKAIFEDMIENPVT
jgi:ArsR family transcriptional regulator